MKTIAIHQPNYMPWMGYFYKMSRADVFVILDDVDFQQGNAYSLTNRTSILGPNGPFRLTVPVQKNQDSSLIKDVKISDKIPWARKHLRSLQQSYGTTIGYQWVAPEIMAVLESENILMATLNRRLIETIAAMAGIQTPVVLSSELQIIGLHKDEKLASICQALEGTHYLSGSGGRKYIRPEIFQNKRIQLLYTDFQHPEYQQGTSVFMPGLSILDAMCYLGKEVRKYFEDPAGS